MATRLADHPWEGLPPAVADALRAELPELAEEIVAEISRGVPEYARPIEGPFGRGLRTGVEEALGQFVAMVGDPDADRARAREVYVNLGRGEMRAGRSLDALLAAYRLGARVAWRRLAAAGERAGLEPRLLYLLAESIFAYIDELSGDSIEGFALEQAAAAGELQRLRQRLAALLIQDPAADRVAVEAAAAEGGWPLPRRLAALAAEGEDPGRLAARLGPAAVVAPAPPLTCALIADPDAPGRRRELEAALRGRRAALGPAVRWPDAAVSFARAAAALRVTEGEGLVLATEHKLPILLALDRRLTRDIADAALEPLAGLRPTAQERLTSTLEAWLRYRGRTEEVARALHVHPQTVRYRMARLRELFGQRLDDPDTRFELELALRAPAAPE
jgi:PucR-like helix-turn-helix protein